MFRLSAVAAAAVALSPVPAAAESCALVPAPGAVEKVARSEVVFVGRVTAVEKDPVMLPEYPGSPDKVAHTVAVVKVEKGLFGTGKAAEFRVAFVPGANGLFRPDGGIRPLDLPAGREGVFFLTKPHPGGYYTIDPATAPLDPKAKGHEARLEVVTRTAALLADPAKALKADKPEDRVLAAAAVVYRYRAARDGAGTEVVKVPAEESRLILEALACGDWSGCEQNGVSGLQAFYALGLTDKDGWVQPVVADNPVGRPVDFTFAVQDAFLKWLDGPGKDYRIKRVMPKK